MLPKTWTASLFAKLQARYGHKWTSSYPTAEQNRLALQEWGEGLADLSGEQLKHGLDSWDGDWPPTLPEFRKACLPDTKGLTHNTAAYRMFPKALPKPKANPEIVRAELAKMRAKKSPSSEES